VELAELTGQLGSAIAPGTAVFVIEGMPDSSTRFSSIPGPPAGLGSNLDSRGIGANTSGQWRTFSQ